MRVTGAKWVGGELILTTTDPDAVRFAVAFEEGDYTITKAKKPRSKDANALAWLLIDRIAAALHMSKEEIYKNTIRDIGGNSEMVCVAENGLDKLKECWTKNGIGWQVDTMPARTPGYVWAILYYGSSSYDSRQMSILIDHLKQDCIALGLPLPDDDRINSLLEEWNGR